MAQGVGYDPDADPYQVLKATQQAALESDKLVLVVFGSDWCPDCRSLNKKMAIEPLADTLNQSFSVMHVDVGNWDKNMAFTEKFGEPIAKGIPSIAVLDKQLGVYYVAQGGEFASARSSKVNSLNNWFKALLEKINSGSLTKVELKGGVAPPDSDASRE